MVSHYRIDDTAANGPQVGGMRSHAYGLTSVPYNNYPALLHEGERVLTAAEARRGGSAVVNITGNQFTVREEADVDRIASAIASRVSDAMLTGGGLNAAKNDIILRYGGRDHPAGDTGKL